MPLPTEDSQEEAQASLRREENPTASWKGAYFLFLLWVSDREGTVTVGGGERGTDTFPGDFRLSPQETRGPRSYSIRGAMATSTPRPGPSCSDRNLGFRVEVGHTGTSGRSSAWSPVP